MIVIIYRKNVLEETIQKLVVIERLTDLLLLSPGRDPGSGKTPAELEEMGRLFKQTLLTMHTLLENTRSFLKFAKDSIEEADNRVSISLTPGGILGETTNNSFTNPLVMYAESDQ